MTGDLLGAADRRDVLGALSGVRPPSPDNASRSSATRGIARRAHFSHGARRAGVHDDLAHDPPARVVRLATVDEEAGERLGDDRGAGLAAMHVQMTQRLRDAAAVLHRPCKLARCAPGLAG